MKRLMTFVLVLVMVLAFAATAMADIKAVDCPARIDKKAYDSFTEKFSANNKTGYIMDGIILKTDAKSGWFIIVNDDKLAGTLELAYKIGSDYFAVDLAIDGAGEYRIGDGSGKNGLNHVKIGAFKNDEIIYSIGFIGYIDSEGEKIGDTFYWQYLKAGEAIDWEAVFAAYGDWVAQGGYGLNYLKGWQTSGAYSEEFDGIAPHFAITEKIQAAYLENDYEAIYFCPICADAPDEPVPDKYFVYIETEKTTLKAGETFLLYLMLHDDFNYTQVLAIIDYDSTVFEYIGQENLADIASEVKQSAANSLTVRSAPVVNMFEGAPSNPAVRLAVLEFKVKADLDTSIESASFSVPTATVYPTALLGIAEIKIGPGNSITINL